MRRKLAAAALLIAVAAAPVAGLPEAHAQAPNLGGLDTINPLPIGTSSIGAQPNLPADVPAPPHLKSSAPAMPLPINIPSPRVDAPAPQLSAPASLPSPETPASLPTPAAAPATATDANDASAESRDVPEIMRAAAVAAASDETRVAPSERAATRDLGAWIPGVTVPLDEPVPDRSAALSAPVAIAPALLVPEPVWASTVAPPESVTEPETLEVVEEAPAVESEPIEAEPNVRRDVSVVPPVLSPRAFAFVPPAAAPSAPALSTPASPAAAEAEPAIVQIAATAESTTVQAAQPAPDLPRINSPAPEPALSIPTLASLDVSSGVNLSWFAALFGVLGSAALGLHLLLRRIEASL
jgi:hypothetical protein